jgi:D-ribose pyranose/furanose isomerase RbsD
MKSAILRFCSLALLALALAAAACAPEREENEMPKAPSWEARFQELLPALGHRNWIVVADSAFPLQISPGMEVLASGEDLLPVLDKVLAAVDKSRHLRPKIYLDQELAYVTDELKPGAQAFREQLNARLKGREVSPVLHEQLIGRLDEVAKTFKILMIKTNLAIPYTSVFLELDCGYWPSESEAKMREQIKATK